MPDFMDRLQEHLLVEADAIQQRARLPDASIARDDDQADCMSCGDPIDPRRLAALPNALRCIGCEQLIEARSLTTRRR